MTSRLIELQHLHAPARSQAEALAAGRALRATIGRSAHADYVPGDRDPLGILRRQNATRLAHLVPLRTGRMLRSPFAFYRGAAAIMAADLAGGAATGITVTACGDAHFDNFGLFASPERAMVFDLNDFDEATEAPWEWDVKRLVTSVVVGGRDFGFSEEDCRDAALETARAYRESLQRMMTLTVLDRYFFRLGREPGNLGLDDLSPRARKALDRATRQALRRTSEATVEKITTRAADGTRRLVERPPLLTHLSLATEEQIEHLFEDYRRTVPADVTQLLSQFSLTDAALRVVGVGSVGTRCHVVILTGPQQESLVLQIKEAQPSVLTTYGGVTPHSPAESTSLPVKALEGYRVVASQRILQAVSDPFLGHLHFDGRDYYVRQFRDRKGAIEAARLRLPEFVTYVGRCAAVLARGHAQSRDAAMAAGYLGSAPAFDRAVTQWAVAYADQSLADYERLRAAVDEGDIEAVHGV